MKRETIFFLYFWYGIFPFLQVSSLDESDCFLLLLGACNYDHWKTILFQNKTFQFGYPPPPSTLCHAPMSYSICTCVTMSPTPLCCVFRPANRCSTCHSLVEIICFCIETSFFVLSVTNGRKRKKKERKAQFSQESTSFWVSTSF